MFQSTRPRGARRILRCCESWSWMVSIHAPAWGATTSISKIQTAIMVSIHAPAWGATPDARQPAARRRVSIHAPAWGATRVMERAALVAGVSIHAPAWGATRIDQWVFDIVNNVSIHAPAWGATSVLCAPGRGAGRFNPRARVGRDSSLRINSICKILFQSTRPRGARRPAPITLVWFRKFQSTRPRGARLPHGLNSLRYYRVSIHAPAWGATGGFPDWRDQSRRFNPRARVGRDPRIRHG